ncbi:hypothetical protein ACWPMX_08440 [Tsuneonella sp. HG094]
MPKPSPQLFLSGAASVLAMVALALSAPTLGDSAGDTIAPVPAVAGIEMPSLPALPAIFPR